jgi:hypothetical protein
MNNIKYVFVGAFFLAIAAMWLSLTGGLLYVGYRIFTKGDDVGMIFGIFFFALGILCFTLPAAITVLDEEKKK